MGLFGVELGEYSLNGDQICVCDWSLTEELTIYAHHERYKANKALNNTLIASLDPSGYESVQFASKIGLDHLSRSRNGLLKQCKSAMNTPFDAKHYEILI